MCQQNNNVSFCTRPQNFTNTPLKRSVGFDYVHVIALALMQESAHMGYKDAFISKLAVGIVGN